MNPQADLAAELTIRRDNRMALDSRASDLRASIAELERQWRDAEGHHKERIKSDLDYAKRELARVGGDDLMATDPAVSEKQRKAMCAAASGNSNLGIPKDVGEEYCK